MIRPILLTAASLLALSAPAVLADGTPAKLTDAISLREHAMENVGDAARIGGGMLKGEVAFSPAAASGVLHTFAASAVGFGLMFPAGTEKGDTEARETIWTDRAGFDKAVQKFIDDTYAAAESKPADIEAFKVAFGTVTANCKSCHEAYRIKKN